MLLLGLSSEQGLSRHFIFRCEREFLLCPHCALKQVSVALFLSSPGKLSMQ